MTDVKEADNGTWYADCPRHGLVASGVSLATADASAEAHDMQFHDGE